MFAKDIFFGLHILSLICTSTIDSIQAATFPCNDGMSAIKENGYVKEHLTYLPKNPNQIAVSHLTGNIYYIDFDDSMEKVLNVYLNNENEHRIIYTGETIQTMAFDNRAVKLYLGFKSGLKIYDEYTKTIEALSGITQDITKLSITQNGDIYAVTRSNDLYKYTVNSNTFPWEQLNDKCRDKNILDFVVDSEGRHYIRTLDKAYNIVLKVFKMGYCHMYFNKDIRFNNLATDNYGRVFGLTVNSIYRLYPNQTKPEIVRGLRSDDINVGSAAPCFDKNNNMIIVNVNNVTQILVLKPVMFTQQKYRNRRYKS